MPNNPESGEKRLPESSKLPPELTFFQATFSYLQIEIRENEFLLDYLSRDRIGRLLFIVHAVLLAYKIQWDLGTEEDYAELNNASLKELFRAGTRNLVVYTAEKKLVRVYRIIPEATPPGMRQEADSQVLEDEEAELSLLDENEDDGESYKTVKVISWDASHFSAALLDNPELMFKMIGTDLAEAFARQAEKFSLVNQSKAKRKKRKRRSKSLKSRQSSLDAELASILDAALTQRNAPEPGGEQTHGSTPASPSE